jgi:heptosyltransferase-3
LPDHIPASVAILQLGRLGDMILTTPLFDGLRHLYPNARIAVIADRRSALIPRHHPSVDAVLPVRDGLPAAFGLARRILERRYDLYVDPKDHRSTTSHLVAAWIRADRKLVHPANLDGGLLPSAPEGSRHYVDRMLAPLHELAPDATFPRRPSIHIPAETVRRMDERLDGRSEEVVTVNVSAGQPSRTWEPEKWKELVASLCARTAVAVISTPQDRSLADEMCRTSQRSRVIATATILEAAAVVARSIAVVTPDTSIVHLASAFDVPTVGLYPSIAWNAALFAPLARRSRMVMAPEDQPVSRIEVREVLDAIEEVFGGS